MATLLEGFPRVPLAHLPTPLERLARLGAALGTEVWIKRDDCTGLATGGNKTRKLEYLIGDALGRDADAVITYGAIQSNHARQTAAACARVGLECHLILVRSVHWDHPEYETSGNVLLDDLLGAHLHKCAPAEAAKTAEDLTGELSRAGKTVYVIPAGGSNAIGALGYVQCARELLNQTTALGLRPELLVHATSSGGTQAGLIVGTTELTDDCRVLGINVYDSDHAAIEQRVHNLTEDIRGLSSELSALKFSVAIDHDHLGDGYGQPTEDTIAGIRQLAELHGIVTDPVYSGKALGALVSLIRDGRIDATGDVVFIHTGGVAVQSVYGAAFARPTVRKV